ncbi:Uncharacterised protein [Yersinia intermedia]|uniref:Uncharacterized protein n=1 Tax=Yersinia intermedia TaxID=631 RepID=A0A0H5M9Y7_YERIN|nr:Uncharacterised protein [Yersinia intermedia]
MLLLSQMVSGSNMIWDVYWWNQVLKQEIPAISMVWDFLFYVKRKIDYLIAIASRMVKNKSV